MGNDSRSKVFHTGWKHHLKGMEIISIDNTFPNSYNGSIWAAWENRIKKGRDNEEKILSEFIEKSKNENFPDDWYSEDYYRLSRITKSMYAALIVSMWAELEFFFKGLIRICSEYLKNGVSDDKLHKACVIKDYFKKVGIKLDEIKELNTVNAIRILNNAFKHNNGSYELNKKNPCDNINEELCEKWYIDARNVEIDYSRIPINELVLACNTFCCELINKVESTLEKRAQQD